MSDALLVHHFLARADCDAIVTCYRDEIGAAARADANPAFDARVLHRERVRDLYVRALLDEVRFTALHLLRAHYALERLYSESTHVVRWSAGQSLDVHADNAHADGTAHYSAHRTHSAVLFLNESPQFTGGVFYFAHGPRVPPRAGTLLGFGAGLDCAHGVEPVQTGERYTVALFYTMDATRADLF